jgi:hypothetical protein
LTTLLAISAAISNADRGMPLLVLLVMLQFVLAGCLFPADGQVGLQQLGWVLRRRPPR